MSKAVSEPSGILLMDKPQGFTSHDVVAKLRGILHTKRIGHGGTLDPLATGVLPVFIGGATRAADFAAAQDKAYIAGFTLGYRTRPAKRSTAADGMPRAARSSRRSGALQARSASCRRCIRRSR